jgi:TonB family protein
MMKKEVNYCASCQEFCAQNFSFCPHCGIKISSETSVVSEASAEKKQAGSGYRITIVAAKNVKQRNWLIFGAAILLICLGVGGVVYSIFNKTLDLEAVETNNLFAFIDEIDPVSLDPSDELKKNKKKDGGGGGGRKDKSPVQKGAEATQTDNPLFSPSKDYVRLTNPEIKIRAATLGTKQVPVSPEPYGLQTGGLTASDGEGCCGGQGNSQLGRGQGNDPGDGLGPGKNGGSGNDGDGPDGGNPDEIEKRLKVKTGGVTTALNIISKPRANYTDQGRENLIQGKVVLKVTFLASGGIGPITVVSGLPGGLTEQAIAAARAIKFEPAKSNGVAISVSKTIEYTFSIF